jgi:dipeptidyl aminopeptidase/acylaminoacyl peptidase
MTRSSNAKPNQKPSFRQFSAVRQYQPTLAYSPDGSEIAYSTNTSGQFNLWRQSIDGGYPRQLTVFDNEAVRSIAWSPDGNEILFTSDSHGDEFYAPKVIGRDGGAVQELTNEPGVQYFLGDTPYSKDGRWISYGGNDREPTEQDIIIQDVATGEERRLMTGADGAVGPSSFSPDGRYLTGNRGRSNTDVEAILIDLESGETNVLALGEPDTIFVPGPWLPDSSGFWILSNKGREFIGAAIYDLATREFRWDITPDWDLEHFTISDNGSLLVWVINENGRSVMKARDLTSGADVPLPAIPLGVIGTVTVAPDGSSIALLLARPSHSNEVFVVDLKRQETRQLTHGMLGGIDESTLIEPELITYPTFDGKQIPAWLYRPKGDGPFPVVLSIHGGPEAQEQATYNYGGLYQYLLSRGIGVLAPNVRGSTGYGISYQKLIHRDWGGDELKDFEAAAKYLQSLPWVKADKLAVYGGSFGGFATLSCVSRLPQYWAAAVDIVGPSNLVTFAKAVPPTWRAIMKSWVGDPETEVEFLMSRSPITFVDQIRAPLFVIQGANDPRVVKAESDQIVERLRARGVDVRYDVYEDEGHGFTKRSNMLKAMGDIAGFLEEKLLS